MALVKVSETGATLPFTSWWGRHAPVSVMPLPKESHEPQGPTDGHGPSEHAGDHPNENATNGPGNNGQGAQK